jgi:acyl-CoA reductase-like NAD-dependent aldehyde dehydrogenase
MLKLADLVEQHRETLATIETWDNGMLSFSACGLNIH